MARVFFFFSLLSAAGFRTGPASARQSAQDDQADQRHLGGADEGAAVAGRPQLLRRAKGVARQAQGAHRPHQPHARPVRPHDQSDPAAARQSLNARPTIFISLVRWFHRRWYLGPRGADGKRSRQSSRSVLSFVFCFFLSFWRTDPF